MDNLKLLKKLLLTNISENDKMLIALHCYYADACLKDRKLILAELKANLPDTSPFTFQDTLLFATCRKLQGQYNESHALFHYIAEIMNTCVPIYELLAPIHTYLDTIEAKNMADHSINKNSNIQIEVSENFKDISVSIQH